MQTPTFEKLKKFITEEMVMSHVYQPIMLMTLLQNDGDASAERIAKDIAQQDPTQVEYYTQIVKKMVGKVLSDNRKITQRTANSYHLLGFEGLAESEKFELIQLCEQRLADFQEKRGTKIFNHRRRGHRPISGSVRYAVLKRAKFRCELCGIHDEDRWLEVDHINPKSLGGKDSLDNYQALCFQCNQAKGNSDNTDFRKQAESYSEREIGCIFCESVEDRIIQDGPLAFAIRDGFPVTPLHTLIIPRRHVRDYFGLFQPELNAINRLVSEQKEILLSQDDSITGFNIGANCGGSSGQTIFHCHIHLIPRRDNDVDEPCGGIRNLIPGKGKYTAG